MVVVMDVVSERDGVGSRWIENPTHVLSHKENV